MDISIKFSAVFGILGITFLIAACTNKGRTIDKLHDEVMRIHDEVMPKQSALSEAQMDIKKWIALQPEDFNIPESLNQNYIHLQEAEEAMWEWMNQYKKPSGSDPTSAIQYLENQQKSISAVRDKMLNSLDEYEKIRDEFGI